MFTAFWAQQKHSSMNYTITKNQLTPLDPNWEKLISQTQKELIHPGQKKSFFFSRSALLLALKASGYDANISDLELTHFSRLKNFPELTLSLSHSQTAGAALVGKRSELKSVGIDIEAKSRNVNDAVAERIHHQEDFTFNGLEAWCLKEAIYKALMNLEIFSRPIGFSQIQLLSPTKWIFQSSNIEGEMQLFEYEDLLVAQAWIKI